MSPGLTNIAALTTATQQLWDSYNDLHLTLAGNRLVLVVEGDDDKRRFEAAASARRAVWSTALYVIAAGSRTKALRMLDRQPSWFGLVDRDTWSSTDVSQQQQAHPHLYVTEGWCMENDILAPATGDSWNLADLEPFREAWVRAGAVAWALQRAREVQSTAWGAYRFGQPTGAWTTATTLESVLAAMVAPTPLVDVFPSVSAIVTEADQRAQVVLGWVPAEQWLRGTHGKQALPGILGSVWSTFNSDRQAAERAIGAKLARRPPYDALLAILLP